MNDHFLTADDRQQHLGCKPKVSTLQCVRCSKESAALTVDTDSLADKDSCEPCE